MITAPCDFDDEPAPATKPGKNGHHPESFETAVPVAVVRPDGEIYVPDARVFTPAERPRPTIGRSLPHSLEAEEYLLSSCLLDGPDVLPRCLEARINPESFYDPKHGIIFECLINLHSAQKPIDVSVLAEQLKATRQLDQVGGYAFLTQVSSRIPTTAQASYFIDVVRQQAKLRAIIRSATGAVEDCYGYDGGDIDQFASEISHRLHQVATDTLPGAELEKRAFSLATLIPKPAPIYSVANTTIATPGNLVAIYSHAKTGKSSFLAAMLSASMTNPASGYDTLGVQGPNYDNHAVLHFDTEQAPYDWQQLVQSSLRRVALPQPPPWLLSYTLAGLEATKAEAFIQAALRAAKHRFKGIHSVFIDGVADLVNDPNNSEECFPLVTRLQAAAIDYHTAIVTILHMNPAAKDKAEKGRGHLGSQLERKAESNLTLKKEGDVTTVIGEGRQRGKPIPADKSPSFKWSDEHGMHRSCGTPETDTPAKSGGRRETYAFSTFKNVIPTKDQTPKPLTELAKACSVNQPITAKQLFNVLARWEQEGCITIIDTPQGRRYRQAV